MVDFYIGTMGFSYRDWSGVFYPQGLKTREYLAYYAHVFNAVEIDSTFYGTPTRTTVIGWRESTPDGFKISVKVPRLITHDAELVNIQNEMMEFLNVINELGEKLGVILFQFPPSFRDNHAPEVHDFFGELPQGYMFAVEFRHSSWYTARTADMLVENNISWAATEFAHVPKEVDLTSDFLYIRFIGQHKRFARHDKEQIDVSPQLNWWWEWIKSQSESVHSVYGFFNDDFSGHAPATANRLKSLIGLPVVKNDLPKQMRFF
jgi:uncharacterized protein YecE (DUF72 family)